MRAKPLLRINETKRIAIKADGTVLELFDAKRPILSQPTLEDMAKGIRGDHANCAHAIWLRRETGCDLAWVLRSRVYVEAWDDKTGKLVLRRYIPRARARESIGIYDKTKKMPPEAVLFDVPRHYEKLDAIRAASRRHRTKEKSEFEDLLRKAHIIGQTLDPVPVPKLHKKRPRAVAFFKVYRDPASGMFQFPPKNPTILG